LPLSPEEWLAQKNSGALSPKRILTPEEFLAAKRADVPRETPSLFGGYGEQMAGFDPMAPTTPAETGRPTGEQAQALLDKILPVVRRPVPLLSPFGGGSMMNAQPAINLASGLAKMNLNLPGVVDFAEQALTQPVETGKSIIAPFTGQMSAQDIMEHPEAVAAPLLMAFGLGKDGLKLAGKLRSPKAPLLEGMLKPKPEPLAAELISISKKVKMPDGTIIEIPIEVNKEVKIGRAHV